MRTFLPITGPGGRALTPKEKIALALLAVTLIVCVLTMIAGEQVFVSGTAQNPVFELIAIPSRLLGGGVLAKLSRRFGEGLVNGALTARVGVAAIEVCRPLPFTALPRPKARNLIGRALRGFVPGQTDAPARD